MDYGTEAARKSLLCATQGKAVAETGRKETGGLARVIMVFTWGCMLEGREVGKEGKSKVPSMGTALSQPS